MFYPCRSRTHVPKRPRVTRPPTKPLHRAPSNLPRRDRCVFFSRALVARKLIFVKTVAHMDELKAEEPMFLQILLSLHYHAQLLTPCGCPEKRQRKIACTECLQAELLCSQCWVNKHRRMPTHWALIWNARDKFFEKTDFCRVLKSSVVALGHYGERCPNADPGRTFTLVEKNGIHATAISFCRCQTPDGQHGAPEFQQLLRAGIFPGSVKGPKTGYTLGLLDYYREQRSQGKGSAYNFVHVLRRMADPFFEDSVPDILANFLAITRFHQHLETIIRRGHAHRLDDPLPGEADRPYPNRPLGYLGVQCAACPERGVNMPLVVNVPKYLRHLISQHLTLDGNFKANLFFKRDDGSDKALTDGRMYFPKQAEFDEIVKAHVVSEEDKEVPCKAHIGSIRHQGSVRYGNTAVSGVVSSACDHAVVGAFVDMIRGEAFALGTYAQREHLKHANSPPHSPVTTTPTVYSYDSWCSFIVNLVNRAVTIFPEEEWLHTLLAEAEGQIPADHINGHGLDCQTIWQAVYFGCRAHFHGETAEMIWAFLNPLGSSTRQSTGAARKDIINFVMDIRNQWKVLRQAQLLADERLAALQLFEVHMSVVQELSSQHPTEVPFLTIDNMLASMIADEQEKMTREDEYDPRTSVARWLHDGIGVEREQILVIALLKSHQEHPLQDTWATITTLRDSLNLNLKKFREHQREIYPRLKLSALDVDEPEITAIQLPSYRMKHGQPLATDVGANDQDLELREGEIKLRCIQADSGILAVRSASHALSAVKRTRELDYRGQAGKSRSDRSLQKAELMKVYEITMYNRARDALIHLGHMVKDAVEPYPPLTHRDTRRKETHLHRAKGDSRVFDGTAWYLQSGVVLSRSALLSPLSSPAKGNDEGEREELQLLTGTPSLKRTGTTKAPRPAKRLRDMAPDDVVVEASSASEAKNSDLERSPSKQERRWGKDKEKKGKGKKRDGWKASDRVQWFRAEAEMYRWIEQYERKHAELFRVIERYQRDSVVWAGLADRESERIGGVNGAVTFARMQAAMYGRLEHNAKVIFKSPDSGAHADWVSATTFDELVSKIDAWREAVFKWMDTMDIHRAYRDF
ncbi:CxC2 domain-containing protein [Mycena venus]|uniref:CxC2 domain-containing protein n=1 Tax=Mycena venus TaxID=2733690 RepID=A0A8H6X4J1_9AGAR|nr:CxC2 domain-containing protein [Mycena venus]